MKKILFFGVFWAFFGIASADAAVRDTVTNARTKSIQTSNQPRTQVTQKSDSNRAAAVRKVSTNVQRSVKSKPATRTSITPGRAGTSMQKNTTRLATETPTVPVRTATRAVTTKRAKNVRAATDTDTGAITMAETRTGSAYEQCKSAYFQCMDQFCSLKNEEYRRCSCSDRVMDLSDVRDNLTETNSKLTEFTENLDIVGMTAAQATALHTASDGENALTADTSASKALLQAIMNSIRGEDSSVGGKMSDLNSINISFDTANAFGITDSAQLVAQYNGSALYSAVYPNCRKAVASDCNDASLQRAVTAYLMSIEQDCNTVQTALTNKQKELKAAVREGSAMLDLARIENRKKHNSDDFTACLANVEKAVLSEEVCGSDYHKCLDNGEYIDVTTGAPIAGVVGFSNLGNQLHFSADVDNATDQRLSLISDNKKFVTNFENKTKKFAKDALDKCSEIADSVWAEYLDKAMLSIYYAQQSKVKTIKEGCFDLITSCYGDRSAAITAAMQDLIDGTTETSLIPDKITLTQTMCDDYIQSCDDMFDTKKLVIEYVDKQKYTDTLAACRAVVQQCFTKYGGANYENFYYPYSGLFQPFVVDTTDDERGGSGFQLVQNALDWFSLYEYDENQELVTESDGITPKYKSPCAREVAQIKSCENDIDKVFGGLDSIIAYRNIDSTYKNIVYSGGDSASQLANGYGWVSVSDDSQIDFGKFINRRLRPVGVATEVYNNIVDNLQNQCLNANGRFVEAQYIAIPDNYYDDTTSTFTPDKPFYCYQDLTVSNTFDGYGWVVENLRDGVPSPVGEYVCPKNYMENVDVNAWGICSCWENGGRRSKNGQSSKCEAVVHCNSNNQPCYENGTTECEWCQSEIDATTDQVKPLSGAIPEELPKGLRAAE